MPTGIPILYDHDLRLRFPGRQINCEETISFCIKVKLLPKMKQLSFRANPSGSLISVKMHGTWSIRVLGLHMVRSRTKAQLLSFFGERQLYVRSE